MPFSTEGQPWTGLMSCPVCLKVYDEGPQRPISLSCGHSVCKTCAQGKLKEKRCPFDQIPFPKDADKLPANFALMDLVGATLPREQRDTTPRSSDNPRCYELARNHVEEMASYLKPLAENDSDDEGTISNNPSPSKNYHGPSACVLSRPLQRKLISLIHCQLLEEEGCSRATRIARSLGERIVSELLIIHQYPHQLSANLWAAVRTRGCQFLGPAMQEEVLKLILFALEDGSFLSRKVLVLFVVQRLEKRYPQASKTAIGHVVQLLYRASCFKVCKRDEASSLMQLKEEFRQYEALRREHDSQIVQIAMEAGLRISPEQWSSLLYGDPIHKSHMQSIIDKHQSPQSFTQSITELLLTLQHLGNPGGLLQLRPQLEFLSHIDPSPDAPAPNWEDLEAVMRSLATVVAAFVDYMSSPEHISRPDTVSGANARYKTSMCRDFSARGTCPRGSTCTFAHSQEEMERYRSRSRRGGNRGTGEQSEKTSSLTQAERDQLKMVEQMSQLKLNAKDKQTAQKTSVDDDIVKEEAEDLANNSEVQVCDKLTATEGKETSPVPFPTQIPETSLSAQMTCTVLKSQVSQTSVSAQMPQTPVSAQMPQTPVSAQMPYSPLKSQVSQTPVSAHLPQTAFPPPAPFSTHVPQTSISPPTLMSTPTPVACHSLVTRQAPPSMPSATSQVPPTQLTFSRQTQEAFEPNRQRTPSSVFPHMSARFPYPHHLPYSDPSLMRTPYAVNDSLPDSNPSQQFPSFPDSQGVQPHQHHRLHHHHHQGNGQNHSSSLLVPPPHIPPLTGYVQNRFKIPVPPTQPARPVDLAQSIVCEVPGVLCAHGITDCMECHKAVHTVPPNMMDGPDGALQSLVFGQAYPMHFPHQNFPPSIGDMPVALHFLQPAQPMANPTADQEQTLEDLTWKKQQILTHLQQGPTFMNACRENAWENSGPAGLDGLQTVLGKNKQKRQAMPKLVSDMYVAARSMCSLEQLIAEDEHCVESTWSLGQDGNQPSQDDLSDNSMKGAIGGIKNDTYTQGDTMSILNTNRYEDVGGQLYNSLGTALQVSTKASESYADSEDSSFPYDDDDNFIPFEHTFVSKFGPISRMARAKTNNCAPVQVTADSSKRTTPVLAVTPIEHPMPTTTRIPSRFNCSSLKTEPVVKPTPTEAPSIWLQSLQPSYQNIACLKAGAAEAVSNNERLAYELQAVELEISLKTGKMPETVSKIIQDAVMGSSENGKSKQEGTRDVRSLPEPPVCTGPTGCHESGIMEVMSHGHVTECLTSFQLGQSLVSSETAARQVLDDYNCSWQVNKAMLLKKKRSEPEKGILHGLK